MIRDNDKASVFPRTTLLNIRPMSIMGKHLIHKVTRKGKDKKKTKYRKKGKEKNK